MTDTTTETVQAIATGMPALDQAIGIGGLPRGRVVEMYGPKESGKLEVLMRTIATAQRAGLVCAVVDARRDFSTDFATAHGVDLGLLLVSQPETFAQALDVTETLVRTSAVDLIVVTGMGVLDERSHELARTWSAFLRKMTAVLARITACLVFVNDRHAPPGGMNAYTAPIKFYASLRLDCTRAPGGGCRVRVIKNKLATPFAEAIIPVGV